MQDFTKNHKNKGNSLVVQWLGLCAFTPSWEYGIGGGGTGWRSEGGQKVQTSNSTINKY